VFRLHNEWQRGFPLVERPFAAIGAALGIPEAEALRECRRGLADGTISRVGVVFAPGAVGASTLAAMEVPVPQLEHVAALVSAQPEVNHNYEREHRLNLWFVATAPSPQALEGALGRIAAATGIAVVPLPLVEEYHIDLGFDLASGAVPRGERREPVAAPLDDADRRLVAAVEGGFPLVPEPFAALAAQSGLEAGEVIARLGRWLREGIARRIGVVVRHRPLGYRANAMAVWDVPDAEVARAGRLLAGDAEVTLCYRRVRHLPQWPYNLFCMVHGRDRASVERSLARLAREHGLAGLPAAVLFSARCFKQCGARYAAAA